MWGRLHTVSKTFVVHLNVCFASVVAFCRIFMAVRYYHRKLLMRFSKVA